MKIKICYTVDADERFRRALNSYYGREGLATRNDVRNWYINNASSVDDDMLVQYEYEQSRKTEKELEAA